MDPSYPVQGTTTVSNRQERHESKAVRSCVSLRAEVSAYTFSGFLERSSAAADMTGLGSHLPGAQLDHPSKMKINQKRTKTLYECGTHRAFASPVPYHISAPLPILAPAERNLSRANWCALSGSNSR